MTPTTEVERLRVKVIKTAVGLDAHVRHCDSRHKSHEKGITELKETDGAIFKKIDELRSSIHSRLDRYMIGVIGTLVALIITLLYKGAP